MSVFALDQLTKLWALLALTDAGSGGWIALLRGIEHPTPQRAIVVSDAFWRFRYAENPGALFGVFCTLSPPARVGVFTVLAVLAVAALAWLHQAGQRHPTLRACVPLIAGAALGNYFDRIRLGYVIDFIEWHTGSAFYWPVFNLADSALVIALALLITWYVRMLWRGDITVSGNNVAYSARLATAHRAPPPCA